MMNLNWIPVTWPSEWREALVSLGTGINRVLFDERAAAGGAAERFRESSVPFGDGGSLPSGVTLASGSWPGTKLSREGDWDTVSAGPTDVPGVDSKGWLVRLTSALYPNSENWVDTKQTPQAYPVIPTSRPRRMPRRMAGAGSSL